MEARWLEMAKPLDFLQPFPIDGFSRLPVTRRLGVHVQETFEQGNAEA